ncbi:AAA family ATPase, partial [Bacillus sp. JJ722]|uniref:AAA family ATPase n=1 Tax=Bacillus sp. JJ722 TaxID=3122973 RepID=UPI002FFFBC0C
MSEKIESIELEAFRAYKDKKKFDFNVDGEAANLVVIYAPNGSGKTTLFDSIEWALTGSISRISDNNQVHDIAEKQKGKILRNTDSSLENGLVKINLTNKDYIEVKTKKLNGRQKSDYRPGNTDSTGIFKSDINKKQFVEKNMLKHHQIDKFLRFQNSRERYQALSVFWDSGKESEKYISLVLFTNEIEKFNINLKSKIRRIRGEIIELSLSPSVIQDLEKQILEFNSYQNEKILFFDNNNYKELYDNSSKSKVEKELLYLKKYTHLNEIEQFYNEYNENYSKFRIQLDKIEQKLLPSRKKMLNNFTIKQTYNTYLNELNEENLKVTSQVERELYLEKNKSLIQDIDAKRDTLYKGLSDYEKKKLEIEKLNSTILNNIQVNEKEL